jgi:hypothetical protein
MKENYNTADFFPICIYESVNLYSHHDWIVDILDGNRWNQALWI